MPHANTTSRTVAMLVTWFACIGVMLLASGCDDTTATTPDVALAAAPPPPPLTEAQRLDRAFISDVKPILNQYCYDCHGYGVAEGDVSLDRDMFVEALDPHRDVLRRASLLLSQHLMPPKGESQPTTDEIATVTAWIDKALNYCDCTGEPNPGRVAVHRLNRDEYNRTIRDLVGVDFSPADDFPADDTGYGFDNIADVLTMSPLLAEKYLAAAEAVMGEAIVTQPPFANTTETIRATAMADGVVGGGDNGGFKMWSRAELRKHHRFPVTATYRFTIRAWGDQAGDEPAKMQLRIDENDIRTFDVPNRRNGVKAYTVETRVSEGSRRIGVGFINDFYQPEHPEPSQRDRNLSVLDVKIEGPLDYEAPEPSDVHRALIIAEPDDAESDGIDAARTCIKAFADRAYRRPATDSEVEALLAFYAQVRDRGGNYEEGVQLALTAALVSPHFLFRVDLPPDPLPDSGVYAVDPYTLASRLSYFIWGSMPDDALFAASADGSLAKPEVIAKHVQRMIADPKADALVSRFIGQWLELRNLDSIAPDPDRFPEFTDDLRTAMRTEAETFFAALMRENMPVTQFIDADFTYVNDTLAAHYGLTLSDSTDQPAHAFRRVPLPADSPRGGVVSMAGVLTVTSDPTRTSPVKRGKWILEQIVGSPPPPPPPNVPSLTEEGELAESASLRERLEAHTSDPVCASCHLRMDPIGFALEPFDALGRFRTQDGDRPIDAVGSLLTGETFEGPDGLKKLLADRHDDFVRTFVEKMLTFALGRGLEHFDRCAVDRICDTVADDDYRLGSVITAIALSDPFRKSRLERTEADDEPQVPD